MKIVDVNAVRFNQGAVFIFSLLGFLNPIFWALISIQLLTTFFLGQKYCLPCRFYQLFIEGGFIEKGPLEDARPPRLANLIGAIFLGTAAGAAFIGLIGAAFVLASVVAALSFIASAFGFCLGCKLYILSARIQGVKAVKNIQPNVDDFLGFEGPVLFTHPLCYDCQQLKARLDKTKKDYLEVDVREKTDLAKKYGVLVVPTLYLVKKDQVELIDI
jgi:hypothetical protein